MATKTSRHEGNHTFAESVTIVGGLTMPDSTVTNAKVEAGAGLSASKLEHRVNCVYQIATTVAAVTEYLHIARAAGTLKRVTVRPLTAPTGGDLAFTVDVQKFADASSSGTTLLDSVVTVNSSSVDHTKQSATLITTPSVAANDAVAVVIATSGSTGTQGIGVVVEVEIDIAAD